MSNYYFFNIIQRGREEYMNNIDECISVIIPVYNKEKFLKRCLESIIKSTYRKLEIIIVDDGSIDNSLELCNEFIKKDSRISVYFKKNGGVSSARNYGLEKCTGKYVAFVDPDDTIEENMFSELKDAIDKCNTDIAYCYSTDNYKNQCINQSANSGKKIVLKSYEYNWLERTAHFTVWGCLFRYKIVKNIRFNTDLTIGEDTLYFANCVKKSNEIVVLDKALYNYYHNDSGVTSGGWNNKKKDELIARELICDIFESNRYVKKTAQAATAVCCKTIVKKYCMDEIFLNNGNKFCRNIYKRYARKLFTYQIRNKCYAESLKTIYTLVAWKGYIKHQSKTARRID